MIDKKKVVAMTKMASYEQKEGKRDISINHYFKSDYIGLQLLKGWLSGTVSFLVIGVMVAVYDADVIVKDIYKIDMFAIAKEAVIIYAIFILIYLAVCYAVAILKYNGARRAVRVHCLNLKCLSKYYE